MVEQGGEPDRVIMYSQTMLMQWCGFAVLIAGWFFLDRSWDLLGLVGWSMAGYLIGGSGLMLLVGVFGYQIFLIRKLNWEEKSRQLQGLGDIAYALPRTRREYIFSNFVSMTAGIVEEIIYRGFVIWVLALFMPLWAAAIVSSLAFGVAHAYQGWEGVLKTGALGGLFAVIYLVTGTIWIPVLLHAVLDMLQMAMIRELHIDRRTLATAEQWRP